MAYSATHFKVGYCIGAELSFPHPRLRIILAVLCVFAGACASDEMSMDEGSAMEGMDHGGDQDFSFGEPADPAVADRTVEVSAADALSFDPSSVMVQADETITFEVTNTGTVIHEFVIGDEVVQDEHEAEMQEMAESGGSMMMSDEPNAISLAAGETGQITWRFTQAGELQFACHQPGHFAGGMVGTFEVS